MSKNIYASELEEQQDWDKEICPRCNCCEMDWEECPDCGGDGGRGWDDLQFEDPLWYDKDSWEPCDTCDGKGGWSVCLGRCDKDGKHKHPEK